MCYSGRILRVVLFFLHTQGSDECIAGQVSTSAFVHKNRALRHVHMVQEAATFIFKVAITSDNDVLVTSLFESCAVGFIESAAKLRNLVTRSHMPLFRNPYMIVEYLKGLS